ncbi:transposase IS116/IS110/IS902 family protein [Wolbachia endosymbiont of Trichogramma pretiosum]|nr:transposase IS116/IS110/IS902 family protein [Wolbachia endosymbiont of Trichogramma pretiosum]
MPEIGYLSRKEVASLAGIAPHPKESGKAVGYRRIMGGRSNVRSKLFISAIAVTKSKSVLGAFYSKLVESGKKMVAIIALMRKIIVIANARLKAAIASHSSN